MSYKGLRSVVQALSRRGARSSRDAKHLDAGEGARLRATGHASANREMFDRIAPTYDALNRVMSLGIDRKWRDKAVAALSGVNGSVLDSCAGTLDFSALLEKSGVEKVVACDASPEMLARGASKVKRTESVVGDALALPFADGAFGGMVCGFGMRNLTDLAKGIREAKRVLAPGGTFVTLELFSPRRASTRALHKYGLRAALPVLGALIAGDAGAYGYLAESMGRFVTSAEYESLLRAAGFVDVKVEELTMGVAALVTARTPEARTASKANGKHEARA